MGEALSAAQAGFYRNSQGCGWCGRNPPCSSPWFLLEFPALWLVWANPLLQPKLVLTKFPEVCLAWAKPFLQFRRVFIGIPSAAVGVGGTPSAAQSIFYRNSQTCGWRGRSHFCSLGLQCIQIFTVTSRAANGVAGALTLVFQGISRTANRVAQLFTQSKPVFAEFPEPWQVQANPLQTEHNSAIPWAKQ